MSRRRRYAPVLEVSELQVRYGKSHVVFDLGLKVGEGEVLALLGRNGAGKTTTIMGIVGLISGTSGHVVIDGVEVGRWPAFRRAKAGIAYVPSGARCFAPLTVTENLQIAARASRNGGGPGWTVERVFEVFPKLEQLRANLAGGLSGGERQMLAVGRGLMLNPKIILLDEPTEGLAPVIVQGLAALIRKLKETGVGILLAEQNHQMALKVADRAAFIEKGRIAAELPAGEARGSEVLHRILGV
jgi:branched-chain amino acid transport system ATP-binding protein